MTHTFEDTVPKIAWKKLRKTAVFKSRASCSI